MAEEQRRLMSSLSAQSMDETAISIVDIQNKLRQLQESMTTIQSSPYAFGNEPVDGKPARREYSPPSRRLDLDEITAQACHVIQTHCHDTHTDQLLVNQVLRIVDFPKGAFCGAYLDRYFGIETDTPAVQMNENEHQTVSARNDVHNSDQYLTDIFGIHPDSLGDTLDSLAEWEPRIEADLEHYIEDLSCGSCTNEGLVASMLDDDVPDWLSSSTYCVANNSQLGSKHIVIAQTSKSEPSKKENTGQRPNLDQLVRVQDHMVEQIPVALKQKHDYRVYRADVIFENNYAEKPYVTKGIGPYVVDVAKMRIWVHANYANVRVQVIKAAVDEANGSVMVQWRMSGIPQLSAFMFWKFLPGLYKKSMSSESEWHEGISTFYVDGEGQIARHRIDRTITEHERMVEKKESLRRKLAAWLRPRPAVGF